MEQLGAHVRVERAARSSISRRPRWTWPSRRPSSVGREGRSAAELERPADVVEERRGEQEVGAQARVELRRLAAERRDADGVLEQAARVGVVAVGRRRAARAASAVRRAPRATVARRPGCVSSAARNSRKPSSSSASRRIAGASEAGSTSAPPRSSARRAAAGRGSARRGRARAPRRPRRSARRAARRRSRPVPRCGRSGRRARARGTARRPRPQPPLLRDRVDALDDAVLRELCDRRHRSSLGRKRLASGRGPRSALPRGPVRRSRAGPLDGLVAPPYDVISPEERARATSHASPYNVVHLTLPDAEDAAAALWREWLAEGVLVASDEPALWWLAQDYVGPGRRRAHARRARRRARTSSRTRPAWCSRTSAPTPGRRRAACGCSRATRTQVEPLFFLYEGIAARRRRPSADLEVELEGVRNRLWRVEAERARGARRGAAPDRRRAPPLRDDARLPRAGRHRGERLAARRRRPDRAGGADDLPDPPRRRGRWTASSRPPIAVDLATRGRACRLPRGEARVLVRRRARRAPRRALAPRGRRRTRPAPRRPSPRSTAARRAPRCSLRPPTIEQVREVVQRGETLPQKSTYFYPKLPSGLLFFPL